VARLAAKQQTCVVPLGRYYITAHVPSMARLLNAAQAILARLIFSNEKAWGFHPEPRNTPFGVIPSPQLQGGSALFNLLLIFAIKRPLDCLTVRVKVKVSFVFKFFKKHFSCRSI